MMNYKNKVTQTFISFAITAQIISVICLSHQFAAATLPSHALFPELEQLIKRTSREDVKSFYETLGDSRSNSDSSSLSFTDKDSPLSNTDEQQQTNYETLVVKLPSLSGGLYKLDASQLNNNNQNDIHKHGSEQESLGNGHMRQPRRFNFLSGFNLKAKASPLYLLNGTLCRFINSQPVCTTLTTTGIMTGSTSGSSSAPRPAALVNQQGSSVQFATGRSQPQFVSAPLFAANQGSTGIKLGAINIAPYQQLPEKAALFHSKFYSNLNNNNQTGSLLDLGFFGRKKLFHLNKRYNLGNQNQPNTNTNTNTNGTQPIPSQQQQQQNQQQQPQQNLPNAQMMMIPTNQQQMQPMQRL